MASDAHSQCLPKSDLNILILGDGDFSFTLAFTQKLKFSNNTQFPFLLYLKQKYSESMNQLTINLISTSFDDHAVLTQKYPHSHTILKQLNLLTHEHISNKQIKKEKRIKFGSKDILIHFKIIIKHGIDATDLSIFYDTTFDLIIFNHPHLGFEHIHRNASLFMHILSECNKIVHKDAQMWITLLQHQYESWNISTKMKQNKSLQSLRLLSSFLFVDSYYSGYCTKRHQSNKSFRRNRPSKRKENDNQKQETQSVTFVFVKTTAHPFTEYVSLMKQSIQQCIRSEANNTERELLSCVQCGKTFDEKRSLISHQKSTANCGNQMEQFKCDECEKMFQSLQDLKQHYNAKHVAINKNIKPDWYQKDEEKTHKHNHDIEKRFCCTLCDKTFGNETQHKQWITPGIMDPMHTQQSQIYKCSSCNKQFTFKRDMLQHSNVCL
eukprot:36903_1